MATKFGVDNPPNTAPHHDSAVTAETSIPSHPAPQDPSATSSGTAASAATTAEGRTDAGAARAAVERTNSWKPSFERRQSWNKEDQKRALQMTGIDSVQTGPGFSEKSS
jgi:hypothetical protein